MAGILDAYFDPGTYGGPTAGLLRNMPYYSVMPTMGAFPGPAADEMSSAGRSPAASPAPLNPQIAPPEQPQPSFLGRLLSGLGNNSNLLMAAGAGLASGGGIGGALQGAMQGRQLDVRQATQQTQQLAIYQAAKAKGLGDAEAIAAALDPAGMGKLLFERRVVPEFKPVTIDQNYGAFNPGTGTTAMQGAVPKFEKIEAGQTGGYVMPPGAAAPGLPGGGNSLQMGGGFAPVAQGMSLRDKAAETKLGETQGANMAKLPATVTTAQNALRMVDELQNHRGLDSAIGMIAGRLPPLGGQQADAVNRINQLKGQTFLEAYSSLRGTGAISEAEGAKATDAVARLNRATTKEAFDDALNDLKDVLAIGMRNSYTMAGVKPPESLPQPRANPAPSAPGTQSAGGFKVLGVR